MNRSIWKFDISLGRDVVVKMPAEPVFRHVGYQGEEASIQLWAEVDPRARVVDIVFDVIGTGWEFERIGALYVGTTQAGPFVWHLYRRFAL